MEGNRGKRGNLRRRCGKGKVERVGETQGGVEKDVREKG
jgi:hypothetical protein